MSFKIKRKIDKLGRIVLPKDIRREYGINKGDALCFEILGKGILVKRAAQMSSGARELDALGRIVVPVSLRRELAIALNSEVLLIPEQDGLYITPTDTDA